MSKSTEGKFVGAPDVKWRPKARWWYRVTLMEVITSGRKLIETLESIGQSGKMTYRWARGSDAHLGSVEKLIEELGMQFVIRKDTGVCQCREFEKCFYCTPIDDPFDRPKKDLWAEAKALIASSGDLRKARYLSVDKKVEMVCKNNRIRVIASGLRLPVSYIKKYDTLEEARTAYQESRSKELV